MDNILSVQSKVIALWVVFMGLVAFVWTRLAIGSDKEV